MFIAAFKILLIGLLLAASDRLLGYIRLANFGLERIGDVIPFFFIFVCVSFFFAFILFLSNKNYFSFLLNFLALFAGLFFLLCSYAAFVVYKNPVFYVDKLQLFFGLYLKRFWFYDEYDWAVRDLWPLLAPDLPLNLADTFLRSYPAPISFEIDELSTDIKNFADSQRLILLKHRYDNCGISLFSFLSSFNYGFLPSAGGLILDYCQQQPVVAFGNFVILGLLLVMVQCDVILI